MVGVAADRAVHQPGRHRREHEPGQHCRFQKSTAQLRWSFRYVQPPSDSLRSEVLCAEYDFIAAARTRRKASVTPDR
ncbi:hypothetical protein Pd630_LPD14042 (plasmid) [Rhodococcus opacus PD630]|nr:hypothetical protein Pd630_LPD14042 [Rhodococcus opacus PD630]